MHVGLIVGNFFSLCAVICIAISIISKDKRRLIWWQTLDIIFYILSNIVLFSYAGIVTNTISLIRNILAYKNKLTKNITWLLIFLCFAIGIYVNNLGYIGFFAVLASGSYTYFVYATKDKRQMLYALISNLMLWFVHDLYIQAYPAAITDVILSGWAAYRLIKKS